LHLYVRSYRFHFSCIQNEYRITSHVDGLRTQITCLSWPVSELFHEQHGKIFSFFYFILHVYALFVLPPPAPPPLPGRTFETFTLKFHTESSGDLSRPRVVQRWWSCSENCRQGMTISQPQPKTHSTAR
jgi:hypothetical protein